MTNLLKIDLIFLACLAFCIWNVYLLSNDGRRAVFETKEAKINTIHLSLCMDLGKYNCSSDLPADSYEACKKLHDLTEFFASSDKSPREIIEKARSFELKKFFNFSQEVRNVSYYLNFRSICMAYTIRFEANCDENEYVNIDLFNNHRVGSKIIIHDKMPFPFITRGYYYECTEFRSCFPFSISIKRYNLILLPKPFSSACKNYSLQTFNFTTFEPIISRSYCIMECLKQAYRLSRFYYSDNDTKILKYSKTYELGKPMVEVKKEYRKCLKICESPDCESRNYMVYGFQYEKERKYEEYARIRLHPSEMTYEATPYIFEWTFTLQFLGTWALIFGVSIITLLFKAEQLYASSKRLKSVLTLNATTILIVKTAIILVSALTGIYLEINYVRFFFSRDNQSKLFHALTPIYPTPFSAVVCFNISLCKLPNDSKIEELSLSEFESAPACSFKLITTAPQAKFEQDIRDISTLKEKSLYRRVNDHFLKCFSMSIQIYEPRYKSILFGTFAVINISNSAVQYLTDWNKRLDNRTKQLKYGFKLKYMLRKFRNFERCENYTLSEHGCDSHDNCLDKCYVLGFVRKYGSIQFGPTPVYAEYFGNRNLKFNLSTRIDEQIKSECSRIYPYKECDKAFITSHDKQIGEERMLRNETLTTGSVTLTINLLFEHNVITHFLVTNPFELAFHVTTLCSVLFGLSFPNLLLFLYQLTKLRVLKFLVSRKVILAISLVGFSFHSFFVLNDSIYSDLIPEFMTNFSYLEPNKHLPVQVFCIDHHVPIDKLPTMTGHDLDQRTNLINEEYVFEKILYHDENYNQFWWYPNQSLPQNLNITTFFINRYKCFEVHYRLDPQNIYSSYVFNIMKVMLNKKVETYLFSYRSRDSHNLIDYFDCKANISYYFNFDFMHEEFIDQFQWIRSPTLMYRRLVGDDRIKYADISSYISELKAELLRRANVTTSLLPLSSEDFEYEIKNEVFKDMIRPVEIKEMLSVPDENFKRNYFNILVSVNQHEGRSMIAMKKVFLHGNLIMTNKVSNIIPGEIQDDYLSIMCNLLNALSVWLNLSLIDLTHYLDKLRISIRLRLFYRSLMSSDTMRRLLRYYRMRGKQKQFKTKITAYRVTLIDKDGNRICLR